MQEKNDNEDPWLEFLREETPYLDDAGFSEQVMLQLPPPAKVRDRVLIGSFLAAFFVLALGLGLSQLPVIELLRGFISSPRLFWAFWSLLALLLFVIVEERVAEA